MSNLYLMCGLPFSGKSYTGKKIAELVEGRFISYDELWKEMHEKTGRDLGWDELTAIAKEQITESLKSGMNVVYDTLNDTVGNRDSLRELAHQCAADTFTIFLDTPLEEIRRRQEENERTKIRHSVPEEKFLESAERFEAPVNEENVIVVKPDTDLRLILRR